MNLATFEKNAWAGDRSQVWLYVPRESDGRMHWFCHRTFPRRDAALKFARTHMDEPWCRHVRVYERDGDEIINVTNAVRQLELAL